MPNNILITGMPGIGKTTAIKKIAEQLKDFKPSGFYTEEIREFGVRKGFRIITLDGKQGILSQVASKSKYRVGKYGVNPQAFESIALPVMDLSLSTKLYVIDEIGKMECFSKRFISQMTQLLDSEKIMIATIAKKGGGYIGDIKKRKDIQIIEITLSNRDTIVDEMVGRTNAIIKV